MQATETLNFGNDVTISQPDAQGNFPLMITNDNQVDFESWIKDHSEQIDKELLEYGAVLFRGFEVGSPERFNELFSVLAGGALEYMNQSSPREKVFQNVYTSTHYPADQQIHMHTESSYAPEYTRIIAFCCMKPSQTGGETPIADERKLKAYLGEEALEKFREKKILYVRNISEGAGLSWQTTYQTSDKAEVNSRLERDGIDYEWVADDHLRIKWVLPAFQTHPVTKEEVWFNHMYFYHKSLYHLAVLEYFDQEDLPFTSYYGDGSDIEDSIIRKIKDFYANNSIVFNWQKDDLLLLDNMMYSHGRKSFTGERLVLTAMSQPCRFGE